MPTVKRQLTASDIDTVIKQLDGYLAALKQNWDGQARGLPTRSWWSINRLRLAGGVQFIIDSLDKLVLFVEDLIPTGSDKKSAVVSILDKLFDYVIAPALPIWLKPFIPVIRGIIIDIVISNMIEFVVGKYNKGIWKKDVNNATQNYRSPLRR